MTRDELIRSLAEVVTGLAVPRSMPNPHIHLGTALDPWDNLHVELTGFGYPSVDEVERELHKRLDV